MTGAVWDEDRRGKENFRLEDLDDAVFDEVFDPESLAVAGGVEHDSGHEYRTNLLRLFLRWRRGDRDALEPLARAIRWNPRLHSSGDPRYPGTLEQFHAYCESVGGGHRDAYLLLVQTALELLRAPRDGTATSRELTPQFIRLGRSWLARRRGRFVPVRDLYLSDYLRWFRNEVTRIIKNEILREYAPLPETESLESQEDEGMTSPINLLQARRWREATRASGDGPFQHEEHAFQTATKTSVDLWALSRLVADAGVKLSPLQHQILNLATTDMRLRDLRDIAERLGATRGTVKNAVRRIRQKL